jgi:1-phosphofructokinase family hexose kinase
MRLATITLNGTLDRVIVLPELVPGQPQSAGHVLTLPSGKGLNVARTALALGAELMTTGLVGGYCGQWICALLAEEGIPEQFIRLSQGDSRISTIIVDLGNKQSTVIDGPGPQVPAEKWPQICTQLCEAVRGYPWVALCGSSPPGLPHSVYADLCHRIQACGSRVCMDARGRWLASALSTRPFLLKCNQYEAAEVVSHPIQTPAQACVVARGWVELGIRYVVVTLGSEGAVGAGDGLAWHVEAPSVQALCPIGSGDAMMAGLMVALEGGDPLLVALQVGVALGAANALVPGAGCCDMDAVPGLIAQATAHAM